MFLDEGFKARIALNGDQAIQAIRARKPALIFMDINMPGKNGLETLREARGLLTDVPVIMLTAYGELEEVLEARKQGLVRHYITKPFNVLFLIKLVRRIMSKRPGYGKQVLSIERQSSGEAFCQEQEVDSG